MAIFIPYLNVFSVDTLHFQALKSSAFECCLVGQIYNGVRRNHVPFLSMTITENSKARLGIIIFYCVFFF